MRLLLNKQRSHGYRVSLIEYSNKGWILLVEDDEGKEVKRVVIQI